MNKYLQLLLFLCFTSSIGLAQKVKVVKPLPPVYVGENGKLAYTPDAQGNQIPDFSYCGYMAGNQAIPTLENTLFIPAQKGDATKRIQDALDYVAGLTPNQQGIRGVVLLGKGVFEVKGTLFIKTSGVVLRGSGIGSQGTTIIGTGDSRDNLITIKGKNDLALGKSHAVTSAYTPVNALFIQVENPADFNVGQTVRVERACTEAWIKTLHTAEFGGGVSALGWKPNQRVIKWDRSIKAINANGIYLDAPITTALDSAYGNGTVTPYQWNGIIQQVGVENLSLESSFDKHNPKDEDHHWMAISLDNVQDAWVRQVTFKHFAGSAVNVQASAKRITVEDCISTEPISEIGGQRRYTFFTAGQQTLFQRLYAEDGNHDFAVGFCAAGPNAFVQCESHLPHNFSGTIDSWASGVLFDIVNVENNALRFANRGQDGQGAGWSAANSVFWQCSAAKVECPQPPTAQNWAFGTWAQFQGDGHWEMSNEQIKPRSLYYAQLQDRLGKDIASRTFLLSTPTEASSSPKVEVAMELTAQAIHPAETLISYILEAGKRQVIPTSQSFVKTQTTATTPHPLSVSSPMLLS